MEVEASNPLAAGTNAKAMETNTNVGTSVAKKEMDNEKAAAGQMIDMIQKAGSILDVTA